MYNIEEYVVRPLPRVNDRFWSWSYKCPYIFRFQNVKQNNFCC